MEDRLTIPVMERILVAIRNGCAVRQAVLAAGVSPKLFREWLVEGRRESRGLARRLLEGYVQARAEAEVRQAAVVAQAAMRDWKAAAWWLEHRVPSRWAKPTRTRTPARSGSPTTEAPIHDAAIHAAHEFLAKISSLRHDRPNAISLIAQEDT